MPVSTDDVGSEDVNDFLQRIKEMGDQRDKEDEERTRKLEEEILQGRKERQARRADRARSLSPTKDTSTQSGPPVSEPPYNVSLTINEHFRSSALLPSLGKQSADMDLTPRTRNGAASFSNTQSESLKSHELAQSPTKSPSMSNTSPSTAMAPSRSNTLSWQQRPSSRGSISGSIRSRPLSSLASQQNVLKPSDSGARTTHESDEDMSRHQVAESLAAKDPSFFKQTQDRGLASAAYRKSPIGTWPDAGLTKENRKLPGMVPENFASKQSDQSSSRDSSRGNKSKVGDSTGGSIVPGSHKQGVISMSLKGEGSPPLPSQPLGARSLHATSSFGNGEDLAGERTLAMSPSQGRISSDRLERPASPTKGLGGFVQSAMMKRSDSVNKRWSAQAGPSDSRESTVVGTRGGLDSVRFPVGGATPLVESRTSMSREATPSANSRPTSSHSNMSSVQPGLDNQTASVATSRQGDLVSTAEEPTNLTKKSSPIPPDPSALTRGGPIMSPPSSPGKRWSPTKSSWLENAISKPDSPKILAPSASQQPAWIADFQRNKQQRGDSDPVKSPTFKEVAVGGLIRSPPPGTGNKPPNIGGLPANFRSKADLNPGTGSSGNMSSSQTTEYAKEASKSAGSSTVHNVAQDVAKTLPAPAAKLADPLKISPGLDVTTKPATPPKKDHRSPANPKQPSDDLKDKPEPEFKNVFGKLKKTQTQNYVAPDELKDNIMRGKSGLAKTSGPQKSNIKDEFKESILKKKERMVAPSASTKITSASSKIAETSTPEAIAKRQGLGRAWGITSDGSLEKGAQAPRPEDPDKTKKPQGMPKPAAPAKGTPAPVSNPMSVGKPKPGVSDGFASSLAGIIQKGPSSGGSVARAPSMLQEDEKLGKTVSGRPVMTEPSHSGPELTHVTKGRARGPKRKPPASSKDSLNADASSKPPLKPGVGKSTSSISSSSTKHVLNTDMSDAQVLATAANDTKNIGRQSDKLNMHPTPPTSTTKPFHTRPSPVNAQQHVNPPSSRESTDTVQESKRSPKAMDIPDSIDSVSPRISRQFPSPPASSIAPQQAQIHPLAQEVEESRAQRSVKGLAGSWGRSPESTQSKQPKPPVNLPTRKDEEAAMTAAGLRPKESVGLGIQVATTTSTTPQVSHQDAASPSVRSPRSPPAPGKKPATIDAKVTSAPLPVPADPHRISPPLQPSSGSTTILSEIFEEPPTAKTKVNVNTPAALDHSASSHLEKIKTLRKQIFEIADNGKAVPVPAQQEHILFEDSLYVCTHVFGTPAGTRMSETYLWCGDGVPPSAVEDAQLFAKKTAKDNNGKLVVLAQGKETARFFQALGGIVIIRKGSSSRSDSATYMLCGRQHLGQIAFDEVDFQPSSLCAGFPYIISARGGRLFLWKGSGAGADELGCARLIGMDLGLTGEIEEIDDGKEPSDFWSSFSTSSSGPTGNAATLQNWHLKSSCAGYTNKLFTVDVEVPRPKSSSGFMSWGRRGSAPVVEATGPMEARIREITPFSQKDLSDEGVFVLDGFFEIFVVHLLRTSLNPAPQHRSTKGASVYAALLFAQEYGILVASAEDRPFVPPTSVAILARNDGGPRGLGEERVPEGMMRCFRKWDVGGMGGGDAKVLSAADILAFRES